MNQKIEIANNWNIQKVFNQLENGNMKIPRFQRGYVWERSKIVKLLNSIYVEHPIGTFFLWEAPTQYSNFCREIKELDLPTQPEDNKFQFIIDGQQRITSLYVALKGKTLGAIDYSSICFNLDKKIFQLPKLKTEPNNIPVWKIFDQQEILKLISQYAVEDNKNGTEYAATLQNCKMILDNYPISIIKSKSTDLVEAVEIFENINQGGKRLSLFDLVHASVWSNDFDLRERIQEFNNDPRVKLYGGLSNETFTQSLALNSQDNCQKSNQLRLTNEDCINLWDKTINCLRLAIDIVKSFGAHSSEILPYDSILPVIQYYFFKQGRNYIDNNHRQLIADWFWSTTFSKRYSSSTLTRQKEDADWIASLTRGNSESRIYGITISLGELKRIQMKHRSVVKNGVLCILAANNPVDFNNGAPVKLDNTNVSRANAKENHHFFPYSRKDDFGIKDEQVNSLLNFAFISKSLNLDISNSKPSKYLNEYAESNPQIEEMLLSHFIDDMGYRNAKNDDFEGFIQARGDRILQKIYNLCKVNEAKEIMSIVDEDVTDAIEELEEEFVTE